MASLELAHVLPPFWKRIIKEYLEADAPTFDIGGYVVGEAPETAVLLAKSVTVLAGVPFFTAVFEELGCTVEWLIPEGSRISADDLPARAAIVRGPCRMLLLGERTALNILSRASGIATAARELADLKAAAKWHGEVAGTRKVTPGSFRLVEKYALLVGGVGTHRMDLSQMVMLKDNHVWAAGSITAAVRAAKSVAGFPVKIEVEARNLAEAMEAAEAGADIVMLDNYPSPEALAADGAVLKAAHPHVLVEASGGISKATIARYFSPHIDVVSLGSLTQGYAVTDFSLKIAKGDGAARLEAMEAAKRGAVAGAAAVGAPAAAVPAAAGGAGDS